MIDDRHRLVIIILIIFLLLAGTFVLLLLALKESRECVVDRCGDGEYFSSMQARPLLHSRLDVHQAMREGGLGGLLILLEQVTARGQLGPVVAHSCAEFPDLRLQSQVGAFQYQILPVGLKESCNAVHEAAQQSGREQEVPLYRVADRFVVLAGVSDDAPRGHNQHGARSQDQGCEESPLRKPLIPMRFGAEDVGHGPSAAQQDQGLERILRWQVVDAGDEIKLRTAMAKVVHAASENTFALEDVVDREPDIFLCFERLL
mmetsp:Transcript_133555/g.386603  ORF Transcript_133555/g.386603 Transcript_133555/m.386603 type:complete len:260 (-) Transcript_133555:1893-2672(-)